jgi:hypothetical protein
VAVESDVARILSQDASELVVREGSTGPILRPFVCPSDEVEPQCDPQQIATAIVAFTG